MNRETTPRAPLDYASLPPIDLSHAEIITDDTAAREFLAAEGKLGTLQPEPPHNTASLTWRSADTNAFCHAVNFRVGGDDGYVILVLPLTYYTIEHAAKIIATTMCASTTRPGEEVMHDLKADQN